MRKSLRDRLDLDLEDLKKEECRKEPCVEKEAKTYISSRKTLVDKSRNESIGTNNSHEQNETAEKYKNFSKLITRKRGEKSNTEQGGSIKGLSGYSNSCKERVFTGNRNSASADSGLEDYLSSSTGYLSKADLDKTKNKDQRIAEEDETLLRMDDNLFYETVEEEKKEKKSARCRKVLSILISIASLYVTFLIYGATLTDFTYGTDGQVGPITMSAEEIAEKQDFNVVLSLYMQTRNLYEEVLTLDYRVAVGQEAMEAIAPEYQTILETDLTLATSIDGTSCSAANQQIKNLLYTWTSTYMSDYCKYMVTALSQNGTAEGEAAGEEAIACRSNYLEPNFQSITQNVITIGSEIKGVDLTDAKSWDPSSVTDKIQGLEE